MKGIIKFLKYLFIVYFIGWISDSIAMLIVKELGKINIKIGAGIISNLITIIFITLVFILPRIRRSKKKAAASSYSNSNVKQYRGLELNREQVESIISSLDMTITNLKAERENLQGHSKNIIDEKLKVLNTTHLYLKNEVNNI